MQTASGAFAAAVTAEDGLVDYKVTVTLPSGVQVSYGDLTKSVVSIERDESVNTTLPGDTVSLISGYPSAIATIVLQGMLNQNAGVPLAEAQSVYWLFNANDPTSPTYRLQRAGLVITVQEGFWDGSAAAELVTTFTGTIDSVQTTGGTVTLTCRDNRSTVTGQATLPPVISLPPYNAGLTSQFAVDYLFRHASPKQYYSWPAPRLGCVLAVGCRSSTWAEVGTLNPNSSTTGPPVFGPGVFGSALTFGSNSWTTSTPILPANSMFIELCRAAMPGAVVVLLGSVSTTIELAYGGVGVVELIVTTTSGATVQSWSLASTGSHYIGLQLSWAVGSTSVSGTLYFDNTSQSVALTAKNARSATETFGVAQLIADGATEGLQITSESFGASNDGFTPTLILDTNGSLNALTALPDITGQDVWSVLQDIAAAENAVIGFSNATGLPFFLNRQTIANATSARTITSANSLINVDTLEQMSLCATHVQIPVNQLQITQGETVWQATSPITVQAGGTGTVIYTTTQNPVVAIAGTDSGYLGVSPNFANTYWRGCRTSDGTGAAVTTGISVTTVQTGPSALMITIKNTNPFPVFLVDPFGTPSQGQGTLFIGGQAVVSVQAAEGAASTSGTIYADAQWPPARDGGAATNPDFGEILLQLPSNAWIQDPTSANFFAADLLSDFYLPRPLYRNSQWTPDPRLQMLDRVTLQDPDVSQVSNDVIIIGLRTTIAAGQYAQEGDVLACYAPGDWILDDPVYSILDVTTYT